MSRKFYAINRETGQRWVGDEAERWGGSFDEFLVMYDSGYLAVVTDFGYDGIGIEPLDVKKWKKVIRNT